MQICLAKSFQKSLIRLKNRQEQKQVYKTIFDFLFAESFESHGLNFEQLAGDSDFQSVRVNQDIRMIIHKNEVVPPKVFLLYVDHHDRAYLWARRRSLQASPDQQMTIQLIDIDESVIQPDDPTLHIPQEQITETPFHHPLMILSDSMYETLQVAPATMQELRKAPNEDALIKILEDLPLSLSNKLLDIYTGSSGRGIEEPPRTTFSSENLIYNSPLHFGFFEVWHEKYDTLTPENDIPEYEALVETLQQKPLLTKELLTRIIHWKSPRTKGYIDWKNLPAYQKVFQDIYSSPQAVESNLEKLISLNGVGLPVASTILHLIYPKTYPILDVRTVETLFSWGFIPFHSEQERNKITNYTQFFMPVIHRLAETFALSIREVDMALFAYHKGDLSQKTNEPETIPEQNTPQQTRDNNMPNLGPVDDLFTALVAYGEQLPNPKEFTTGEIQKWVNQNYDYSLGSILPSDYCYNRTNIGIEFNLNTRIFEYIKRGRYKYLGQHYPYSGLVLAKPQGGIEQVVGEWENGEYTSNE